MIERFPIVFALAGALLVTVGCATKSFVREEMQNSEIKLGQQLSQQRESLNRQESRVSKLETDLPGVAGKATSAAEKASQALSKAEQTDSRLIRLWANRNKRELFETVVLNFGFDKWMLDDRGETTLLGVIKELKENPNLFVDLEGYTDVTGPVPYNVELSQRRVEAVRRFLVEKGVELSRIHAVGLGPVHPAGDNKTKEGRRQNRRVALKVFTPVE